MRSASGTEASRELQPRELQLTEAPRSEALWPGASPPDAGREPMHESARDPKNEPVTDPVPRKAFSEVGINSHNPPSQKPLCQYRDLGRMSYSAAWDLQRDLVARRKAGEIPDQLLFVEHPHVITLGRNTDRKNVLVSESERERLGIQLRETDRGGDVTYHGPGQLVMYPIVDLRDWKRDVVAYVRALEQVIIESVARLGVKAEPLAGCTGVWVGEAKLAAIGIHISRWVTSHGVALNVSPRMEYFNYIVPCGIQKPVTSLEAITGRVIACDTIIPLLAKNFSKIFKRQFEPPTFHVVR
jgi:lipoyl(octanoyl) transferase